MEYLKLFENHTEYETFVSGGTMVKPNVSHCIQENEVHYNPIETILIVKYNVIDASNHTQLYHYFANNVIGAAMFDNAEIDGVEASIADLDASGGTYQFLTVGEHTVQYILKDPTFIGLEENTEQFPPTITKIGATFYRCQNVVSVEIPNTVTDIGNRAFHGCSGLTNITIPNSVTSIGDGAFQYCSSLTSATIGNGVTSISFFAFAGCSGLTSITIGNSVTSIGGSAFHSCSSLTSITIPDSVTSIGDSAFKDCTGLTNVTIGNNVTNIDYYAFNGCINLTSVTIPDSVTSIGDEAFCGTNLDAATQAKILAINPNGICIQSPK